MATITADPDDLFLGDEAPQGRRRRPPLLAIVLVVIGGASAFTMFALYKDGGLAQLCGLSGTEKQMALAALSPRAPDHVTPAFTAPDEGETASVTTPSVATPSVTTPSVATPSVTTPSVTTPSVATAAPAAPSVAAAAAPKASGPRRTGAAWNYHRAPDAAATDAALRSDLERLRTESVQHPRRQQQSSDNPYSPDNPY